MELQSKINAMQNGGKLTVMSGQQIKSLIEAGTLWLKTNQQIVNALNVFPVPDGDTGSNMLLTMQAGWNEIASSQEENAGVILRSVAQGALMGARGNSGVILSQFWRGFSRAMDEQPVMDLTLFSKALTEAKNTAYKGVVRPVEGTILTVLKDTANYVESELIACSDFKDLFEKTVQAANQSVDRTPELLPVLKQAGVVDSGGKGLFFIFEGFLRWLNNEPLDINPNIVEIKPISLMSQEEEAESIEPGQDFEVVVDFVPKNELNLAPFYDRLSDIGTSIQVGEGDGMYRMHIHVPTENIYAPINYIMGLGTVTKVAIENLIAQMEDIREKKQSEFTLTPVEEGQISVVAVSPGDGISRILASLGVGSIIKGGQTMNPSTEEILNAVNELPTDKVIILPNNKNIILAANNAITQTDKTVAVIRSKNVPQGISALLRLDPDGDFEKIVEDMNSALLDVQSGEITIATRTVEINGVQVNEGQIIVIHNGDLVLSRNTVEEALIAFLEEAKVEDYERITIFYGNNIEEAEVKRMVELVQEKYPDHEIEYHYGGQPHYFFIIAIE